MSIYVKTSSDEKKFGILDFYCQRKRVNKDTVIAVQLTHDVQVKLNRGVLVKVSGMPKPEVDNKKKS